jgi:magnesium chelatase family protein
LDGSLRSAGHTGRALYAAWKHQIELLVLPAEERPALARISALIRASASFPHEPPAVLFARNLEEAWKGIDHGESLPETYETTPRVSEPETLLQLPPPLTRALGIAAACNHHLLLLGPRGTGKSRTLEWLKALQPAQSPEHMLTRSLLAEMNGENIASNVRCVGSQVRPAALLGTMTGGALRSGEFALAHGGILIADELPEWPRDSRETLREPLETGRVTLTRAHGSVEFPAAFQFAANGNFCPCGGWPPEWPAPISGRWTKCICGERERRIYLRRLSGPVLDRIDLVLGVRDIGDTTPGLTPVTALKERVIKTRETAHKIWGNPPGRLSAEQTELIIKQLGNNTEKALKRAPNFRSRHKLMRVALSLALWDGEDRPAEHHFDEAALYRPEALGIGTCIEPTA